MSFFEHTQRDNRQILVVDDENDNLKFLSDIFSKMGYETVTAVSGINGLNLFIKSDFGLVFTDSKMILKDGFSLAYHVKARSPETPVVMLIGKGIKDPPDKKEGCCIDYLLFKPFGLIDVQYTLQKFSMAPSGREGVNFHCNLKA
jgi:two-component system NtrC family response regulator